MATKFTDNTNQLIRAFERGQIKAIDATCKATVSRAREGAPKDSGSMAAGIHANTPKGSGYNAAKQEAQKLNPKAEIDGEFPLTGEFENRDGRFGGVVDAPSSYAGWVENGSHNGERNTPGVHFMEKAGDAEATAFKERAVTCVQEELDRVK